MQFPERDAKIEEALLVDLLQRAQRNADPEAYDGIYILYADRVYRYLLVRVGDANKTEEITSQVFLHLLERLHKYNIAPADNVAIFSAWLYRLAYNKMIDIVRKQKRTSSLPIEYAEHIPRGQRITENVLTRIEFEQVLQTMQRLNDQQRQVITLRFVEEMNIQETAQIMNKTEGAVKALQHRALENLRRYLT